MASLKVLRNLEQCPGLHGPDTYTHIAPSTLGAFVSQHQLVIPLMQRRYCWNETLLERWWIDMTTKPSHRVGQLLVRLVDRAMLVVDGQQRLTTSFVLASAIRHALLHRSADQPAVDLEVHATIEWLNGYVFLEDKFTSDGAIMAALGSQQGEEGLTLECARLTHSFLDRRSFAHILCHNGMDMARPACDPHSMLVQSKRFFDSKVAGVSTPDLCKLAHHIFDNVTIVVVDIQTPAVNLSQIFQWHQERNLAANTVLFNPTPGVPFSILDLLRNVVLANYVELPLAAQHEIYRAEWLPFETICAQLPLGAFLQYCVGNAAASTAKTPLGMYHAFMDVHDIQTDARGLSALEWLHELHLKALEFKSALAAPPPCP